MGRIKPERKQSCLFCSRKEAEMPVYSCCLGRMGICLECAKKAIIALEEYQAKQLAEAKG